MKGDRRLMMFGQTAAHHGGAASQSDATLLVDCGNGRGAAVQWHPRQRRLFWTDIDGQVLWSCDEHGGNPGKVKLDTALCAFAFCGDGRMLAAFADGLAWLDPRSGTRRLFEPYMPDTVGVRMQDGAVDRQGRFVAGGLAERPEAPDVPVWSVDRGRIRVLFHDMRAAASIAFSPDGRTMYLADPAAGEIRAYVYNLATGTPAMWQTFARIDPGAGVPGGACIDAEGGLWVALRGGGTVARYLPDGTCDRVVRVPVPGVTACAIGGTALRRLFITTANGSDRALPGAGGLFAVDLSVRGMAAQTYTR